MQVPHCQSGVSELFLVCVIKLALLILWFVCFVDMTNLRSLVFRIKIAFFLLKEIKYMGCFACIGVCAPHVCSVSRDQRMMSDPKGLELQMVVSWHVCW